MKRLGSGALLFAEVAQAGAVDVWFVAGVLLAVVMFIAFYITCLWATDPACVEWWVGRLGRPPEGNGSGVKVWG